jgi:hypothetical protein
MKIQLHLTMLFSMLAPLVAPGQEAKTCVEVKSVGELHRDFTFRVSKASMDTPAMRDLCNQKILPTKTYSTLLFLKQFGDLPLPSPVLDQNILGANAYQYLRSTVRTITFTHNGYGNCGQTTKAKDGSKLTVGAYANFDESGFYLCLDSADQDVFSLASIFVHEARHTQGSGFSHVTCRRGPLAGAEACDESYRHKGSYAIGTEYYLRLSKHPNLDPILKDTSRYSGLEGLYARFNQGAMIPTSALLIQKSDGHLSLFQDKKLKDLVLPSQASSTAFLVSREDNGGLFDPTTRQAQLYAYSQFIKFFGQLARLFRELEFQADDMPIDAFYLGDYGCLVYRGRLACAETRLGATIADFKTISLQKIRPIGIVQDRSSMLLPSKFVFLQEDSGDLYQLPNKFSDLLNFNDRTAIAFKTDFPYRKITHIAVDQTTYALDKEGKIFLVKKAKGKLSIEPVPELANETVKSMAPNLVWPTRWDGI